MPAGSRRYCSAAILAAWECRQDAGATGDVDDYVLM